MQPVQIPLWIFSALKQISTPGQLGVVSGFPQDLICVLFCQICFAISQPVWKALEGDLCHPRECDNPNLVSAGIEVSEAVLFP